jgi:hypothetical protein
MIDSLFYYPMTLNRGAVSASVLAPFVKNLPSVSGVVEEIYVRTQDTNPAGQALQGVSGQVPTSGTQGGQGVFVWDAVDLRFRFALPYTELCHAVIGGASINIYYAIDVAGPTIPGGTTVYRNGFIYTGADFTIGDNAVWAVLRYPSSASGDTQSVNQQTPDQFGNIQLTAVSTAGTGQNIVANNGAQNGQFTFKTIDAGTGLSISSNANTITLANTGLVSVEDGHSTSGESLIVDPGTNGVALLRTLLPGANVTLTVDSSDENIVIASTVPVATASVLGGVKQGAGVAIAGDGTLSVTALGGVTSVDGQTGDVVVSAVDASTVSGTSLITDSGATTGTIKLHRLIAGSNIQLAVDGNDNLQISSTSTATGITHVSNEGTGTGLVDNDGSAGGIATIKSLSAGSNITITQSPQGDTLTITANQTITPATTSVIGGVIVGTGLAVNGIGTLSLAAPAGVNLGGVKAGAGVAIAADGTISVTAVGGVASVSGQTGAVVVQATNNNAATGTSLISDSGSTTGNIKLKTIVAGSGITLSADVNGNLQIAGSSAYTLPAATTTTLGGVIVPSGAPGGLAVDGSGNITLEEATYSTLGGVEVVSGGGITVTNGSIMLAPAGTGSIGGVKVGTGLTVSGDGTISVSGAAGVTSITAGTSGALTGALTFTAGQSISLSNTGNSIQISGTGVPEAPNDGNQYGRQNMGWTVIPDVGSAIISVTGQTGTGAVLLVENSPPANSAIIKSLVAGTNVTITESSGLLTIAASIPSGTVSTVNGLSPNTSGNVTLTAATVNAVPIAGNVTMTGPLNLGSQVLTGIPNPVNPTDAVNLQYLNGLVINGGVIG